MKKKILDHIAIGVIVLLLVGSLLINLIISYSSTNIKTEVQNNNSNDLSKYRSEDIPEECRLPEYDYSIEWWKDHLSHNEETWHCLGYFE
jgi:hypothetical protein